MYIRWPGFTESCCRAPSGAGRYVITLEATDVDRVDLGRLGHDGHPGCLVRCSGRQGKMGHHHADPETEYGVPIKVHAQLQETGGECELQQLSATDRQLSVNLGHRKYIYS